MQSSDSMRAQIRTLIVATSVIQLAIGFFSTFISLRVAAANFNTTLAGLILSSYFAGFTWGALRCARIIERVGHIRAYAAFAGSAIAATASMAILTGPVSWMILRAIVGFGSAGVFVTTESWLNVKAQARERGRVFSIYMVGNFVALAVGQLLIARIEIQGSKPFHAIEALLALALIMVSTTRAEAPVVTVTEKLPYGELARAAPIAVIGCVVGGLVASSFYALVPAWMHNRGVDRETIALLMLMAVFGGLVFQVPVGRLSDRFDRRMVLVALGLGLAATAITVIFLPRSLPPLVAPAALLGGFISTLYPVCVAIANDCMPADRVLAVSGRLLLISGLGSVVGPLTGTSIMARSGISGLFYLMAVAAGLLALVTAVSCLVMAPPRHRVRTFQILAPNATSLAHDPLGFPTDIPPNSIGAISAER